MAKNTVDSLYVTVIWFVLTAFLSTKALAYDLCQKNNDFKWRRYPDTCNALYFCFLGKAVTFRCPPGQVVGTNMRFCVPENSWLDDCSQTQLHKHGRILDVPMTCKPGDRFPSGESCAKFSVCVKSATSNATILEQECPYPQLYDESSQKCSHYANVRCQTGVFVPKNPCEYSANQCGNGPHSGSCIPCNIRFPSCSGLPDGMNSWHGKEWSPYYVICQHERISYHGLCKSEKGSQIFHPVKRECVHFDEIKEIIG